MSDILPRAAWRLTSDAIFLNHGSFGACPHAVLEQQRLLQDELENQPVQFFVARHGEIMDRARAALADFVGADADDLALVRNCSTGVSTVLASLQFTDADELLATSQGYNACNNALIRAAELWRARTRFVELPFPLQSPSEILERLVAAITPDTRLLLIDHITSPTALVFPINEVVSEFERRGIPVLVDGAHAPGMVPLDLAALGASFYTGNCHKWMCAPKGSAFLHVRRDWQDRIRPLTISHGANAPTTERSRFRLEFDWTGTEDPSAWGVLPETIDFFGSLPGGWSAHMAGNHEMALRARDLLCAHFGVENPAPDDMLGSMASVHIPSDPDDVIAGQMVGRLQRKLWDKYSIEVPIIPQPEARRVVRVSAQRYNCFEEYERLVEALHTELRGLR
jgi:isopenicillin-N epimerase